MATAMIVKQAFGGRAKGDMIVQEPEMRTVLRGEHAGRVVLTDVPATFTAATKEG